MEGFEHQAKEAVFYSGDSGKPQIVCKQGLTEAELCHGKIDTLAAMWEREVYAEGFLAFR